MEPIKIAQTKKVMERGQALTELAIFGSILLFCVAILIQYGLRANYQQQVQMEAFRKAQKIAFNRSGPSSSASLVLLKDKPFPDPRDQWGFAERDTVAAGANVLWDTDVSARYVKEFDEAVKAEDLPAVYFEVDKGDLSEIRPYAKADVPQGVGVDQVFGIYTARFEKMDCPDEITVIFNEDPSGGKAGGKYFEVKVKKSDIKIMRIEGGNAQTNYALCMYPYFRFYKYGGITYESLIKRRISNVDVDGDHKLEYVIAADNTKKLFYIRYHDNKTGTPNASTLVAGSIQMIDTDYTGSLPKPYGNLANPEDRQGMIDESEKSIQHRGTKIIKTQDKESITSTTELHATQTITHKIRLNDGPTPLNIRANFTVDKNDLYGPNWKK